MTIKIYEDVVQGSDEWYECRRGVLTASEMKLIIAPKTLKAASNEKEKTHLFELAAQRITGHVEPQYVSDAMMRGKNDEIDAVIEYGKNYGPVHHVGFITNDKLGFHIGFSPDGLVRQDGFIEAKSRMQKYQAQTIIEGEVPEEFMLQIQTGLMVTERAYCDFISYCGGMPMVTMRVEPIQKYQDAIAEAATAFEARLQAALVAYEEYGKKPGARLIPTERRVEMEITL